MKASYVAHTFGKLMIIHGTEVNRMAADRIRTGIIGANMTYGWGSRAHLPALAALPEFELTGVCTTRMETARETAKHFGIPNAFDDPRALINHPDIELVIVCVRVPSHHGLVLDALAAGKHVYCEWPLGANLAEAKEMRDLAEAKGVKHMVGLQARGAPVFNHMKQLIADGYLGQVLSCTMNSSLGGAGTRPSYFAWAADRAKGANTLTIHGGHSVDALCYVLGEFREVSATISALITTATVTDTNETVPVTAPDHMLVNGVLESGALASIHIRNVPAHGTGFVFEVHGTEGALVVTSDMQAQMGELTLRGARKGDAAIAELPTPREHRWIPDAVPTGPPVNMGQMFLRLASGIRDGAPIDPDFNRAVQLHELIAAMERASDTGQRQRL